MAATLGWITLILGLVGYGIASVLFFFEIATKRNVLGQMPQASRPPLGASRSARYAPMLMAIGTVQHAAYVTLMSFVFHVCPIHSVHFLLSVSAITTNALYLIVRRRVHVDALGLILAPLGLMFLLGTSFIGFPAPESKLSPLLSVHIVAMMLGFALFSLATLAAILFLVQENRIRQKKKVSLIPNLPPLETLDNAVHRFLQGGFPLLTIGLITGTYWEKHLEIGTNLAEIVRIVFGYVAWIFMAAVLALRVRVGWRGRRASWGTILGFVSAALVLSVYLLRPFAVHGGGG